MLARSPTLFLLVLATAIVAPAAPAAEHVLCRNVRQPKPAIAAPTFRPFTHLGVRDRVIPEGRLVDVRKPASVCVPSGVDGPATGLTGYRTRPTRTKPTQPRLHPRDLDVETPWGTEGLRVTGVDDLLVPATVAPHADDPGPADAHRALACYDVRARRRSAARVIELAGAGLPQAIEVSRPLRLCVAADLDGDDPAAPGARAGWLCLAARLPRRAAQPGGDPSQAATLVFRDRFGRAALTLGAPVELCAAATIGAAAEAPTPTATPTPPPSGPSIAAIRVEPPHVVRMPGESYVYVAIATMSDGSERNATEDVEWHCTTLTCVAPNAPGDRGRIVAGPKPDWIVSPFDFQGEVYAVDPVTGVASLGVRLEITSTPVPLLIYPWYTIIRQHTFDYLTALALDEDGAYRNATQDVVWTSSDPDVAVATNVVDSKSRILGVGPGIAAIRAMDPRTGAVSGAATFDVFGPLVGIDVRTRGRTISQRADTIEVGEEVRILAWANFDRGFPFEGFEPLAFTSSDPTVAVVEPVPGATPMAQPNGTLARVVRGLAPGRAVVSARDEITGLSSSDAGCDARLTVRAPATGLRLNPPTRSAGLDELVKLTALGFGTDGATRNWTQRVTYASSSPAVAIATNEPGDRSKLVVVGPGTTVISAVDPVTGLSTTASGGTTTLTVRNERADRIDVTPAEMHVPLGFYPRFSAVAHYPSGLTSPVNESVTWTSSAPEVARFDYLPDRRRLYPWSHGTTTITATMPSLGTSSAATLVVEPAVGLTVLPATATIPVGGEQPLTVKIALAGGAEVVVGNDAALGVGDIGLSTSDPAVLRSGGACGPFAWVDIGSPLVARAPGTATISAQIGYAGVTSTETGGDATITVVAP